MKKIEKVIKSIKDSFNESDIVYKNGSCYKFHLVLKEIFEDDENILEIEPYYDIVEGHVYTRFVYRAYLKHVFDGETAIPETYTYETYTGYYDINGLLGDEVIINRLILLQSEPGIYISAQEWMFNKKDMLSLEDKESIVFAIDFLSEDSNFYKHNGNLGASEELDYHIDHLRKLSNYITIIK